MFGQFYKGKRVFITGNTGFKGSWLSIWLKQLGADVRGYALQPDGMRSMYDLCRLNEKTQTLIYDVRSKEKLKSALIEYNPDIIFHLAAQPLVRASYSQPYETFETNICGTLNILESIRELTSVRSFINVTSDKCYENREAFWGYRETDSLGGHDPYSSSKACSELITMSYAKSFFPPEEYNQRHFTGIATARAGNVIGGGDYASDRIIPDCIQSMISKNSIAIRNPWAVRPWQHVLEALQGYLLLGEKLYAEGGAYAGAWNFGPNEDSEKSVEDLVKRICNIWGDGAEYHLREDKNVLHESSCLKLDTYKARKLLGFKSVLDIDSSLKMTVDWYRICKENPQIIYEYTVEQIAQYEARL